MAATSVLVQSQRAYSVTLAATPATATIELVRYVDASAWVSGLVLVTLYSKASWTAGVSATVTAHSVSPAPDDPAILYEKGTAIATVPIANSDLSPKLLSATLSAPIGDYILLRLTFTNTVASTQTAAMTMGVKLIGRDS